MSVSSCISVIPAPTPSLVGPPSKLARLSSDSRAVATTGGSDAALCVGGGGHGTPTAAERLAAAQAIIAKATADKEAAKAATQAAKEAAIAIKEAEKARRAAAKAAREAEKAALPKRPVGRPRKNPMLVVATLASTPAVVASAPADDTDNDDSVTVSIDEASSTGSVAPQSCRQAGCLASPETFPSSPIPPRSSDTIESLRAELAELRTQLTTLQAAYQREHAFLDRARRLFASAPV